MMLKNPLSKISIAVTALIILFCFKSIRIENGEWKNVIVSDARGYYAYLPTLFIYHDFEYNAIYEREKTLYGSAACDYVKYVDGQKVNQYFIGESVLLSPFFIAAHLTTKFTNEPADGYSKWYQLSICIAALFYLIIGLLSIRKLLLLYGIKDAIISFVLISIVFATNLFHYVVVEPGMSHVYSFALIAAFVLFVKQCVDSFNLKYWIAGVLSLLLLFLIRPSNLMVILLVPFIAGSMDKTILLFRNIFSKPSYFLISITIVGTGVFAQMMLWHIQTGKYLVYSYNDQKFIFSKPHLTDLLFSFRKGLFVYTPLLFVSLFGLIPLFKQNRFSFLSILIFLGVYFYVTSSWYMWYYGGSFGMRPVIDIYVIFCLLLALGLQSIIEKKILLTGIMTTILMCGIVNQIQAYQYRHYIIDWERMTFSKYKKVFLKTGPEYQGLFWNNIYYEDVSGVILKISKNDFENKYENWQSMEQIKSDKFHSATKSQQVDSSNPYSATYIVNPDEKILNNWNLVLRTDFWTLVNADNTKAQLVISVNDQNGTNVFYNSKELNTIMPVETGKWQHQHCAVKLPLVEQNHRIKIYLWHTGGEPINVDDFTVEILTGDTW